MRAPAQPCSRAEDLSHRGHEDQDQAVSEAVAEPVEKREAGRILQGIGLRAAHHDAVGDDQADEHAELAADIVQVRLEHLVGDDDQRGDHRDFDDHADASGDEAPEHGNGHIRPCDHGGQGERHDHGRVHLHRDGERGANPEDLDRDRIVLRKRIHHGLLQVVGHEISYPLSARNTSRTIAGPG